MLKISIVTVSYNQGQYIRENIESVLKQGYSNIEHIIVDACSTDGTVEILRQYPHLKWTSEPDNGQSDGLNKGFRRATGDLIVWLNSDDSLCEGALNKINSFFVENPEKYVVTGNQVFINEKGVVTHKLPAESYTVDRLLNTRYCSVMQNATVFRKSVIEEIGLLDETLHYAMDLDLFIRIAQKYSWSHIDADIAHFRVWSDSKTTTNQLGFYKNMLSIKRKHNARFFSSGTLWLYWQFFKYPFKLFFKK